MRRKGDAREPMMGRVAAHAESTVAPSEAEDAHADRFNRVRSAHSTEILEDYTELIAELTLVHGEARVTDIARHLGVTLPTANKALTRLKREGLIVSRPYRGVFLTEAGRTMAERVRERHQVVVAFLTAVGVPPRAAQADAEGIEHHVSDETLDVFRRFICSARD